MTVVVGTTTLEFYNHVRNFLSLPYADVQYRKIRSAVSYILPGILRRQIKTTQMEIFNNVVGNFHYDWGLNRCDLLHFWNAISASPSPWVTTFEHYLPRWGVSTNLGMGYGLKLMARDNCKQLIAMSRHAYQEQMVILDQYPTHRKAIEAKLRVAQPAQAPLIECYQEKPVAPDKITFSLVGHDFFRKGGKEILQAFCDLVDQGYDLQLNIVSLMIHGDYASKATVNDLQDAQKAIAKYPNHIRHHTKIPNDQVLALLRSAHVGLLPSYDDTYGYSVLESQAAGCPVITTNIRALPEVNHDEIGWVVDVPRDSRNAGRIATAAERAKFSATLREGIYTAMKAIADDPASIRAKGERALQHIVADHSPTERAAEIEQLYRCIQEKKL